MVSGMNRGLFAASAVALLLLTGCSASPVERDAVAAPSAAASADSAAPAPLVAQIPSAAASASADTPEGAFLAGVRDVLPDDTVIPDATDQQLLAAGAAACEQMAAGTDFSAVSVIEGEPADELGIHQDSALIAAVARKTICS